MSDVDSIAADAKADNRSREQIESDILDDLLNGKRMDELWREIDHNRPEWPSEVLKRRPAMVVLLLAAEAPNWLMDLAEKLAEKEGI